MRSVVVGAGPAGLIAARDLLARGDAVTVLEASDRIGGRVTSLELDGLTLDAGAESFATRGGAVAALATELGLSVVPPVQSPAWVVAPGRAYQLPATGWLGIPTHPLDKDVRKIIGSTAAVHASLEPHQPLGEIPDDVSVGTLVRSRLGDAIADQLVAPVLQGVYSRPLDALKLVDIDAALPQQLRDAGSLLKLAEAKRALAPAGSAVLGVEGGMWRLTEALAAAVRAAGGRIVTDAAAERLEFADGAWHIDAGGGRVTADRVVLATPLPDAATLVPGLLGGVGVETTQRRQVAVVTLVLDAPELDGAPRGTGVLALEGVTRAKALTHSTQKWPWLARAAKGRHVVRLSFAIDDPREDVAAVALDDAARLFGIALAPEQVRGSATAYWTDAAPANVGDLNPASCLYLVGSAAGLTGLANIAAADFPWAG
jgi:protoporphyrinogen/coproporphyrinogen III oxidase